MIANPILIRKSDGEEEPYDASKLESSLMRAGANASDRAEIVEHIAAELRPGMTTEDIYTHAFSLLKKRAHSPVAARYSVKRALFALGPSGFPFEQFFAEVLRSHGWRAETGVTLTGRCAPHEVDILAEKSGLRVGIEAKFHNDPSGKTDIKDALYVKARYEDLARSPEASSRVAEGWLVTNTRFTKNAIRYAQCTNLTLIGWDYPDKKGLLDLIEAGSVHPITCLTSLSESEKRHLLENRIVLCKDIRAPHLLESLGVRRERLEGVMREASALCGVSER